MSFRLPRNTASFRQIAALVIKMYEQRSRDVEKEKEHKLCREMQMHATIDVRLQTNDLVSR